MNQGNKHKGSLQNILILICILIIPVCNIHAQQTSAPGVVVNHIYASTKTYIGSPSICIMPGGDYIATHDIFGPSSDAVNGGTTMVYRSSDKGATWNRIAVIRNLMWATLFRTGDKLFALGTAKQDGYLVICRSDDQGKTWTAPAIISKRIYHTAPVPVAFHKGRVWRDVELVVKGAGYHPLMISAGVKTDLTDSLCWMTTNAVAHDPSWLNGKFKSWLEGNAVVTPGGEMVNILRVVTSENGQDMAAMIRISGDGTSASFDPSTGFMDFAGGARKFAVKYDKKSKRYWCICNYIREGYNSLPASSVRNTLVLKSSEDLVNWVINSVLIHHPDAAKHGYQYADWAVEKNDIIFLSRTAHDDDQGGAGSYHDSNYLTFHRIKDFRKLDSAGVAESDNNRNKEK